MSFLVTDSITSIIVFSTEQFVSYKSRVFNLYIPNFDSMFWWCSCYKSAVAAEEPRSAADGAAEYMSNSGRISVLFVWQSGEIDPLYGN
jgi:hypothetical protein